MVMRMPQRARGGRTRTVAVVVVLVGILSISTIVRLYTDLLWYQEVEFASVFWTILGSKLVLSVVFGLGFFILSLVNLLIVARFMPVYRLSLDPDDVFERYRGAFLPYVRWIAIGVSALLALLFALIVTPYWDRILLAMNSEAFGQTDPLFGKDIGFYVFRFPFYQFLYGWLFAALVVVTLMVGAAHYLTGGIRPQSPGDRVTPQVKAHLSALVGLIIFLRGWGYRLDQFGLLFSSRGDITGASYTDVHAERPALTLLIFISIIVAVLFLVNIRQRGWVLPLAGLGLWVLISILARGAYPYTIQRFTVDPAQLQREGPFIERNIAATRTAYGVEGIEVREHQAITGITREDVDANRSTIDNVRIWDPTTLARAYRQLQEIRTYYQFVDVDVDRYEVNGQLRQVMLSAREMAQENLPTKTWQNVHVVFTHGYGTTLSPTNETDPEGHPNFFLRDIPPTATAPELEVEQPGIYFGEFHDLYSLVITGQQELDYGTPEEVRFTTYEGKGGVPAATLRRRLAFAWRFRNVNLAISRLIEPGTRIIYNRRIQDRLRLAAPFLHFDGDPYPVIADGRMVWIADAYVVSSMYPYSELVQFGNYTMRRDIEGRVIPPSIEGRYNYIRNSVKATVDAYDGTVTLYVWDEEDPIIRAWRKIFPDLFTDASEMSESIRRHVRYPEDLFKIQTQIYLRYHMTETRDFYTQEDIWVVPPDPTQTDSAVGATLDELQPYYVLMRPPGSAAEEYVLIRPMNPRARPNMVAWVLAKSGPAEYGKLIDFRFPRGRLIHGVTQIAARINARPEIARTITLLDQRGSRVIRGNLLVMPMGDSVLYVQPLFVQSEANPLPELNSVILATSEDVVMAPNIDEGLRMLLEREPGGPIDLVTPEPAEDLVQQALDHLRAAREAAQRGDWAAYGREIEAAERALAQAAGESEEVAEPAG